MQESYSYCHQTLRKTKYVGWYIGAARRLCERVAQGHARPLEHLFSASVKLGQIALLAELPLNTPERELLRAAHWAGILTAEAKDTITAGLACAAESGPAEPPETINRGTQRVVLYTSYAQ